MKQFPLTTVCIMWSLIVSTTIAAGQHYVHFFPGQSLWLATGALLVSLALSAVMIVLQIVFITAGDDDDPDFIVIPTGCLAVVADIVMFLIVYS